MKYLLPFIVLLSTLLVSCSKTEANFKLNKNEYAAGEMIDYTNYAQKNRKYVWEILAGDSTFVFEGKNPTLRTNCISPDGVCILRLTTYNYFKKINKTQEEVFFLKTKRGSLSINNNYTTTGNFVKNYEVYVDDQYIGKTTNYYFTVKLPIGTRLIKLKSPSKTINVTAEISLNNTFPVTFKN